MKKVVCVILACMMMGCMLNAQATSMDCSVQDLLNSIAEVAGLDSSYIRASLIEDFDNNSLDGDYGVFHYTVIIDPITRKVCGFGIALNKIQSDVLLADAAVLYDQWLAALSEMDLTGYYGAIAEKLDAAPGSSWNYTSDNYDKTIYTGGYVFEFRVTEQWAVLLAALENVEEISKSSEYVITEKTAQNYAQAMLAASDTDCVLFGKGYFSASYNVFDTQTIAGGLKDNEPINGTATLYVYANEADAIKAAQQRVEQAYYELPDAAACVYRHKNAMIVFQEMNTAQQADIVAAMITTWAEVFA